MVGKKESETEWRIRNALRLLLKSEPNTYMHIIGASATVLLQKYKLHRKIDHNV